MVVVVKQDGLVGSWRHLPVPFRAEYLTFQPQVDVNTLEKLRAREGTFGRGGDGNGSAGMENDLGSMSLVNGRKLWQRYPCESHKP